MKTLIGPLLFAAGVVASPVALACCPTGTGGAPLAKSGLGEEFPPAVDLAPDSPYQVYGFEREGVRYLQVNASDGRVLAIVGYIGDTFWTLPAGADFDRIRLPGSGLPSLGGVVVYQSSELVLKRLPETSGGGWAIEVPADR